MLPEMHIATFMNLRLAPEALDLLTARQYRDLEEHLITIHPTDLRASIRAFLAPTEAEARRALAAEVDRFLRRFMSSDSARRQVFRYEIYTQRVRADGGFWSTPVIIVGGWRSLESELRC